MHKHLLKDWVILIIDDEPDNLIPLKMTLSHLGAEIHIADNGQTGLDILKQIKPTIILLDLSMPVMDGWEMLSHLQARPETSAIPVIAVTAHAMVSDKERVLDAGFAGYLTKPFRPSTIIDELEYLAQCTK